MAEVLKKGQNSIEGRRKSSERMRQYNKKRVSKYTPELKVSHGLSSHPIYTVWFGMMSRCYNKKDISYKRYGGKGVVVCADWRNDFMKFYNWAINSDWKKGLQIDKDYNGDGMIYSPETCKFVTRSVNCRKRSTSRIIEYNGESKTLSEWCEKFGLNHSAVIRRIERGWDNSLIFKPSRHAKNNTNPK